MRRKNLDLHPLHSPISTFTPHSPLTASRPALTCSESQLHSNPRCSAGQSQGQGDTSTPGGSLDPAEPPRPQDYSSQTPAPGRGHQQDPSLPSPRKTEAKRILLCFYLVSIACLPQGEAKTTVYLLQAPQATQGNAAPHNLPPFQPTETGFPKGFLPLPEVL